MSQSFHYTTKNSTKWIPFFFVCSVVSFHISFYFVFFSLNGGNSLVGKFNVSYVAQNSFIAISLGCSCKSCSSMEIINETNNELTRFHEKRFHKNCTKSNVIWLGFFLSLLLLFIITMHDGSVWLASTPSFFLSCKLLIFHCMYVERKKNKEKNEVSKDARQKWI